ncbi:hypothetical protein GBA52_019484 [Prunus armeniaca]|nr:hypothetical protein GBA52_019484 [Prunus armeniaca]
MLSMRYIPEPPLNLGEVGGGEFGHSLEFDIAASVDEEDVAKFTDVVKEFDSMTPLESWKTTLLLRVKEKLKSKELVEDDLT